MVGKGENNNFMGKPKQASIPANAMKWLKEPANGTELDILEDLPHLGSCKINPEDFGAFVILL